MNVYEIQSKIAMQICRTPLRNYDKACFYWVGYIMAKHESGELPSEEFSKLCDYVELVTSPRY